VVSGVRQWTKLTYVGPGYNWDWWPSSGGYTISGCNQPTRSTQPCIPPGWLNRVRAGMSPLPGGRLYCVISYGMWVPVAVRCIANCYTPFTLLYVTLLLLFTFLVPAHPGSLGKRAVKCVCVLESFVWLNNLLCKYPDCHFFNDYYVLATFSCCFAVWEIDFVKNL